MNAQHYDDSKSATTRMESYWQLNLQGHDHIANEIIRTEKLDKRLALLAREMKVKIQGASGRKYQELLQCCTTVYVQKGEVLSAQDTIHEKKLANEEAQQFREAAESLREEVDKISSLHWELG